MEAVDVCARIVDHGLRLLKMDAKAAARIGLAGLHICPGHPFAAQLWLDGVDGVHGLEVLPEAGPAPLMPDGAGRADLLVRFFPAVDSPALTALTGDERALRRDPGFDGTGAPDRALTRALFETPLFGVGLLRLALDPAGAVMAVQGVSGTAAGWAGTRPLHDLLMTVLAFVHRVAPLAVVGLDGSGQECGAVDGLHAVLPWSPAHPAPAGDAPTIGAEPFVAAARAGGPLLAPPAAPARWWSAGGWEAVPEAALCACHAGDGGHDGHVSPHHHHHDHDHHHRQEAGLAPAGSGS
ncbi:hypothetical protein [Roseospira visakhapatnamensis]|uniref:Uncharacterized protein n=1 Tax=Roseospira visakhapatnamensis TaxID=390880 RepID=A0A7W6RAH9_9PROT|nr:hypothetical protein [Roseospira visakhapatnamensis]MBB4264924.1 hypothetical protein [Roseospira visakhapatnamensis]